jgi:type II secretory pathway component HofQ
MAILSLFLAAVLTQPLTVSLDLRDVDLRDFLVTMAESANLNAVLHPAVEGKITLKVQEAPWETLLEMVLRNYRLGRETQGNVMRIAPQSVFEEEYRQRAASEEARLNAQPLETRSYVLKYANVGDIAVIVSRLLSPRGIVVADLRRNVLIVKDVAR